MVNDMKIYMNYTKHISLLTVMLLEFPINSFFGPIQHSKTLEVPYD